ncbi:hypothetical protein HRJ34_05200 [Rhizorhabdus wittichii]|uniref:Uncharacterized protein n=1 Tax=Rhizorhabdus wittichii TaxID=160791 RepID=A0A975D521_9SPHN|nr:hypothetical protein [Rhizorhabdus wittichii]QTH22914.1 hypothetical protein HRJ34_05200 [Rhizorhabdus wittichii]
MTDPRRIGRCGTRAMANDPHRAAVLERIGRMVDDGLAEWSLLAGGEIRLRLLSGEVFLLGTDDIFRLA